MHYIIILQLLNVHYEDLYGMHTGHLYEINYAQSLLSAFTEPEVAHITYCVVLPLFFFYKPSKL